MILKIDRFHVKAPQIKQFQSGEVFFALFALDEC